MTVREFIEQYSFDEKMLAATAISGDNNFLTFTEGQLSEDQYETLMRLLAVHVANNGRQSIRMAILAGKAIKSSIEYPIKPKTGPVQWFKNKVKEMLA